MPWVRLDDQMPEHPKFDAISDAAFRLHIHGLCYCARQLTDGVIAQSRAAQLMSCDDCDKLASELVDAGLWERTAGGYVIHDYLQYNPTRAAVLASRQANAKRQQSYRDKHSTDDDTNTGSSGNSNGVTNTSHNVPYNSATNAPPVPSRPVPIESKEKEVGLVARALEIDRPTNRQTKRLTNGLNDQKYRHLNGEMVADAYAEWQDSLPPSKQHKDRVSGFLNQLEMRREQPAYFREAAPSSNGASSNGKHEIASDGREYGSWLDPTYVRHDTPIPSDIPEVQTLFQTLKSFGTCSMREWDELFSLSPQVRPDGTIIFRVPDEQAHEKVKRYYRDLESACRETDLRFEIGRDA